MAAILAWMHVETSGEDLDEFGQRFLESIARVIESGEDVGCEAARLTSPMQHDPACSIAEEVDAWLRPSTRASRRCTSAIAEPRCVWLLLMYATGTSHVEPFRHRKVRPRLTPASFVSCQLN